MTAHAHRWTAAARRLPLPLLLLLTTFPLGAQLAAPPKTSLKKFKFSTPSIKPGAELRWEVAKGGKAEVEKDEYAILQNDVRLYYQDITIRADKVTANLKTKDVVAEGNVIIDQGPTRITASQAVFNLDSKTGTFFNSTATLEPTLYFAGEKVEKISDDTYRLTNGLFTSCDLDRPAWSFHVKSADITLDSYAHMKDVSFRARRVPIFWTPRLVWPTKHDRSQGLLIPRLLLSGQLGSRLELGYFIPFGDAYDATLYADLNTKGYNGVGVNVRYAPSTDVKLGNLSAYAVHDAANNKQQWKYAYQHSQENLPGGFRGVVDIQDYSDLDFFRSYDRDPRLHTLSNIYSSAYLTRNRPTYSLNLLADRRDILLGHATSDPASPILKQRFEQLPSLQFRMYPQRVADLPLYFSLESSASHLRTSGLINGPTADYERADLFPTLSLQLRTPAWLSIKPQLSARETYYTSQLDENSITSINKTAIDQSLTRFYAQGQVEVVGPSFSRVYNDNIGGFTKFKHIIEPRFRYIYTTDVRDQSRVIRFDTVDTPFLPIVRDSLEYSLTQRLIGKEAGPNVSPREILSFSLRQTVALSKPFTSASGGNLPGSTETPSNDQKFTPLVASLHVNPYQSITLDANATFGNLSHQI
ncbi:MAG: lptD, partial [Acidobacteria bacterium]|nr:lptD [Acidobacteriota bacterium]